jgi:Caspase domain
MTVARMTLIAGLMASPILAEGRVALIVASTAAGAPEKTVRGDALDLSESLFGMGFTVTRLENPTAAQIDAALAGMPKTGPALFYFAGPAVVEDGKNILLSGTDRVPLDAAVQMMTATGRAQSLVILDTCHGVGSGLVAPDDAANLFVTLPNAPEVDCVADVPSLAVQLLEKVAAPGVPLADLFPATQPIAEIDGQPAVLSPGLWVRSSLTAPFILREATPTTQLSAADYRMLENLPEDERANLLALWQAAGIAIDIDRPQGGAVSVITDQTVVSPVQPLVQTASIIAPVAAVISPIVSGNEVQGEQLAILAAAPVRSTTVRPVPGAGGLPRPSVILGEAATLAALETPAPDQPPAQTLDYTDITARSAAKAADPAEYDRLILAGSYDPPPDQLPVAVQTELKRMGCYRGGIDGQWGPGSRRALQLYFDTLQAATTTQEPTIEVFHQLLQKDDVACPVPVAAAPAPAAATTTRNTTRATTQAAPTTRRQPAAAAPAPAAPATTGRRIRTNSGTGAFR